MKDQHNPSSCFSLYHFEVVGDVPDKKSTFFFMGLSFRVFFRPGLFR